jgi:hypothetical protein
MSMMLVLIHERRSDTIVSYASCISSISIKTLIICSNTEEESALIFSNALSVRNNGNTSFKEYNIWKIWGLGKNHLVMDQLRVRTLTGDIRFPFSLQTLSNIS